MELNLDAEAQAALDLAKRAVPAGGELDVGLLIAALYHGTNLKQTLPSMLMSVIDEPRAHSDDVPAKVPVAKPLQPILGHAAARNVVLGAGALFKALIDSEAGRRFLQSRGVHDDTVRALQLSLDGNERNPDPAAATAGRSAWRDSAERRKASDALGSYGRMLTASAPPHRGCHGMERALHSLARTLSRMRNRSAIIVGPSGAGKTALVYEFARQLYEGAPTIPQHLRELDLFELSPVFLRSGASVVGQYEQRVKELLEVLEAHPNIVLFVDEIHTLLKSGMHERDPFSEANGAFKGKLAAGRITCLGCTTLAEYRHYIEPDAALARRFTLIRVEAPSAAETVRILQAKRPMMAAHFSPPPVEISDAMLARTVELTEQYLPSRSQPAKSIQLLDEACAHCVTADPRLDAVTEDALWQALEDMIGHGVVRSTTLTEEQVFARLGAKILGQDETLHALARAFMAGIGGWSGRSGPRGVFFFCGPTGVGKTETALLLQQVLSGNGGAPLRVNCNTLQGSGHDIGPAINILLGPPPGYLGYVRGAGGVLSAIRDQPESVVLFDEIEKADPGVAKLLLQVLDEGRIEDNEGNPLDFHRAFIVFTTNAGCVYDRRTVGFSREEAEEPPGRARIEVDAVKSELRAIGYGEEFFGRIDQFFVFESLRPEAVRRIIGMQLERLRQSADVRGFRLDWDAEIVDHLTDAWQPRFGVRHLTRILRNRVVEQLSVADAQGELQGVSVIRLRRMESAVNADAAPVAGGAGRERSGDTLFINLT